HRARTRAGGPRKGARQDLRQGQAAATWSHADPRSEASGAGAPQEGPPGPIRALNQWRSWTGAGPCPAGATQIEADVVRAPEWARLPGTAEIDLRPGGIEGSRSLTSPRSIHYCRRSRPAILSAPTKSGRPSNFRNGFFLRSVPNFDTGGAVQKSAV